MKREEVEKVVENLNERFESEIHCFWYQGNYFMHGIKFDDIVLWDSETDERRYIGKGDAEELEDLLTHVLREFENYVNRLRKINYKIQ